MGPCAFAPDGTCIFSPFVAVVFVIGCLFLLAVASAIVMASISFLQLRWNLYLWRLAKRQGEDR